MEEIESFLGKRVQDVQVSESLSEERMRIYGLSSACKVFIASVDGAKKEFILTALNEILLESCQITFEDLPISWLPEYRFADDPEWRVAKISLEALEDFKQKKFKIWERQLREPECEAAFRRLLQQGPICRVFDKFIFPSSEEVASLYKVTDEHSGKVSDIPHQVSEMRMWNAELGQYQNLDCRLHGAPQDDAQALTYWQNLLSELKELRGEEYINSLIKKC